MDQIRPIREREKIDEPKKRHVMLDPTRPVMLAFLANGELLHPDHGSTLLFSVNLYQLIWCVLRYEVSE